MKYLLVAAGGAGGAALRYAIAVALSGNTFPFATLLVNVVGCFLVGVALPSVGREPLLSSDLRLLLVVGFFGGFTTFSAFGHETIALIEAGRLGGALAYVAISVALGLAAVVAGRQAGAVIWPSVWS